MRSILRRRVRRSAFTLLELILALGLAIVILAVVIGMIRLNLVMLQERRSQVEEVQLAHAVLHKIAGDLRATLSRQTTDLSGLEGLSGGMGDLDSLADLGSLSGELGGEAGSGSDSGTDSGTSGGGGELDAALAGLSGSGSSTSSSESTAPAGPPPGIYGSTTQVQVDVSRLPRLDEYQGTWDAETGFFQPPSDVKTVTYFLIPPPENGAEPEIGETPRYGLMRHEMGRSAALYQAESGVAVGASEEDGESLCPEVEYLEFRYFDGTGWLTDWDAELNQGLPRAVEVTIRMGADLEADEVLDDELARTYSMVVQIPLAANNAAFEEDEAAAAPDAVDETAPDAPDAPSDDASAGGAP